MSSPSKMGIPLGGFQLYTVNTHEVPTEFIVYVVIHVVAALSLIAYWVFRSGNAKATIETKEEDLQAAVPKMDPAVEMCPENHATVAPTVRSETISDVSLGRLRKEQKKTALDHRRSLSDHRRSHSDHRRSHSDHRRTSPSDANFVETSSAVESSTSAATTTVARKRAWEPSHMRWKHRQPMGRVETLQRKVERNVISGEEGSQAGSRTSWNSKPGSLAPSVRGGLSDKASNVLNEEHVDGEAEFYRHKYRSRVSFLNRKQSRSTRSVRSYTSDGLSVMPALNPDQVSPEDAADAHDPGRSLPSVTDFDYNVNSGPSVGTLGGILDLANPDAEIVHIARLAIPSTIVAVADPLYRVILAGIISHKLGTDAMVSFVLVQLLLRLTTDEISGALLDAEWSLVQGAMGSGFLAAGKYIQLGMILQLVVGVPVLLIWVFLMEDMVQWLVSTQGIAAASASYTQIVVVDCALQGVTRAFMLAFQLTDRSGLESTVDSLASIVTLITVAVVISVVDGPSLQMVAYIQVVVGVARTVANVGYVYLKGWVAPYGLCKTCSISDRQAVMAYIMTWIPLLMGSLIELREWELLSFAVKYLGGAELTAWVVMGIIWEVFEASIEGLGESAAVRVSYYLGENIPVIARRLCRKVVFWAFCLAALATSMFLMVGPNVASALTIDWTVEHLLFDLVGMVGLANITMSLAQVYWSLVGAQGRFGTASLSILLVRWLFTMPLALVCIFVFRWELPAVAGAIAVGYVTSAVVLAHKIYTSDWEAIAKFAQAQAAPLDLDEDEEEYSSESEYDEDDSALY